MILRHYEERDRDAIIALFEARPGQLILDPAHQVNPCTVVLEDNGRILAAVVGRIKLEVHLALDHTVGTPQERLGWIEEITEYGMEVAAEMGAPDIEIAALPRERSWIKRIEQLPFVVKDERAHFRLVRDGGNDGQRSELRGSGDGAASARAGGSAAVDEHGGTGDGRSRWSANGDPEPAIYGCGGGGSLPDPEQAVAG